MLRVAQGEEVGAGIFSRVSLAVYRGIVLEVFLVLLCAPTVVAWTLLDRSAGNGLLFLWAAWPVVPALSAALFAVREWTQTTDLQPTRALLRGLRQNLGDVAKWWTLVLAVASVLVVNVSSARTLAGGTVFGPVSLVLLVVLAVLTGHLLVVTSLFSFRTRDAVRIAVVQLFSSWRASLGYLSLLVLAVTLVVVASEAVLVLAAWAFVLMLWRTGRPVIDDVTGRFVALA